MVWPGSWGAGVAGRAGGDIWGDWAGDRVISAHAGLQAHLTHVHLMRPTDSAMALYCRCMRGGNGIRHEDVGGHPEG